MRAPHIPAHTTLAEYVEQTMVERVRGCQRSAPLPLPHTWIWPGLWRADSHYHGPFRVHRCADRGWLPHPLTTTEDLCLRMYPARSGCLGSLRWPHHVLAS
jgi:hypothetical protein